MKSSLTSNLKFESLDTLVELKAQFERRCREAGASAVKSAAKVLFDTYPQIVGIKWAQYTPYFNDGDECIFGVHGVEYAVVNPNIDQEKRDLEARILEASSKKDFRQAERLQDQLESMDEPDWHSPRSTWHEEYAQIDADLDAFENRIQSLGSVMKTMFDDHSEVTVTRTEVKVESYEHE